MYEMLKKLNGVVSPTGQEEAGSKVVAEMIAPFVDEVRIDPIGNVIAHKKGNGKRVMFAAHIDCVGLMVTYIEDGGFIRFAPLGGPRPDTMNGARVQFFDGTIGIVCKDDAFTGSVTYDKLFIDIGAKDGDEVKQKLRIGDYATFDSPLYQLGQSRLVGPYMDDRLGIVTLIKAVSELKNCPNDLWFAFTVLEEVSSAGAKTAATQIDAEYGVAVDVIFCSDVPDAKKDGPRDIQLGKGPAIKYMDRLTISSPKVNRLLEAAAERKGIALQREAHNIGGSDSQEMQRALGGMYATTLSIPLRYMHTPAEMCEISDLEDTAAMLREFMETEIK